MRRPPLWLLALATSAVANPFLGPHGRAFSGCMLPLNFVTFADNPSGSWAGRLSTENWINSIVACMSSYAEGVEIEEGWERLHNYARLTSEREGEGDGENVRVPTYEEVLVRVVALGDVREIDGVAGGTYNETVRVSRGNYENGLHTQDAFANQMWLHSAFGTCMYLLLVIMTIIGVGNRLLALCVTEGRWFVRTRTWIARHISTPALMGYRHVQPWGMLSIPTRLEGILIGIYVFLNILFSFICYDVFEENLFFYHQTDIQYARYFADRTGIMSFYNMVLLFLLAGRNDIVIWLTGWSYQSMNLFHRWTARVATFQGIAHSIGYSYIKYGKLWRSTTREPWGYWATGVYATIVMSLLLPLSIRPLRVKAYEIFLSLHIVFSLLVLIFLFLHVYRFGFAPIVYLSFGIWIADRLLRIARVVYLSYRTVRTQNAQVEITAEDPALLRLTVTSTKHKPKPGDYYFLYSPWWPENHPFTLASWNQTSSATELSFLIAPMAGWTWRLRNSAHRGKTTVLLEGPYGHTRDLKKYDNVLLLAGGSGIASLLPYVASLRDSKVKCTLVWVVRNAEYAADVLRHELAEDEVDHVDLVVYLTQQLPDTARTLLGLHKPGDEEIERRRLELRPGRPDVRDILDQAIVDGGKMAVMACGPAAMMDDVRYEVGKSYGSWFGAVEVDDLDYFEESFTW